MSMLFRSVLLTLVVCPLGYAMDQKRSPRERLRMHEKFVNDLELETDFLLATTPTADNKKKLERAVDTVNGLIADRVREIEFEAHEINELKKNPKENISFFENFGVTLEELSGKYHDVLKRIKNVSDLLKKKLSMIDERLLGLNPVVVHEEYLEDLEKSIERILKDPHTSEQRDSLKKSLEGLKHLVSVREKVVKQEIETIKKTQGDLESLFEPLGDMTDNSLKRYEVVLSRLKKLTEALNKKLQEAPQIVQFKKVTSPTHCTKTKTIIGQHRTTIDQSIKPNNQRHAGHWPKTIDSQN